MKKVLLVAAAVVMTAGAAMAQLQVAQTAEPVEVGKMMGTAGVVFGMGDNDVTIIGARATYGAMENLTVHGDVGYAMDGEDVMVLAIGAQYALAMVDVKPVDLAVRAQYSVFDFEFKDGAAIEMLALASLKIEQVDGLSVYGGIGINLPLASGADTDMILDIGAKYALPVDNLSMYVEFTHVADSALGLGVIYSF